MKTYRGHRDKTGCVVTVYDGPGASLLPRPAHDRRPWNWCCSVYAARPLAAALIADSYGVDLAIVTPIVVHVAQYLVSGLDHDDWMITEEQLACAVAAARQAMQEGD